MVGTTIGQYRILAPLGRGGAGTVYKALDETLNREVAIKILNPDLADSEIMKRFRAEATTLARLNHPEIATIYELFRSETDLLMVMEFVRGETLEHLSNRVGPMPPERAAYIIDRVLSALEHAHRAGVVHRDLKPANVMVTEHGGVKIMDFGIARVRGADHVTLEGYMMGTPAYMPPEQVLGQEIDGRADLYSAGVVLYRLLTGALPFNADTAIGMLQRQVAEAPIPLHLHREGLPDWCEPILQRALAKSPGDRFQTADEFRDTLGRATGMVTMADFAKGLPASDGVIAVPPPERSATERFAALPSLPVERTAAPSLADGSTIVLRKTHFAFAWIAVTVLTVSVAVLAYFVMRHPPMEVITVTSPPPVARQPDVVRPLDSPIVGTSKVGDTSKKVLVPLTFETKILSGLPRKPREREARLVLADGQVAIMAGDDGEPLRVVAYESVMSISYSRTRDPMWRSPTGPVALAHVGGGAFGIFLERHWIALRTDTDERFIVLRFDGDTIDKVLRALEERTGRTREFVAERKRKNTL